MIFAPPLAAETENGFWIGYWSWFDPAGTPIDFRFLQRHAEAVQTVAGARSFAVVDWFSHGWWAVVDADAAKATLVDLRFGDIPTARDQPLQERAWPFAWEFDLAAGAEAPLVQVPPQLDGAGETLKLLWQRLRGGHVGW